mgnify:CR=1 FL=1
MRHARLAHRFQYNSEALFVSLAYAAPLGLSLQIAKLLHRTCSDLLGREPPQVSQTSNSTQPGKDIP